MLKTEINEMFRQLIKRINAKGFKPTSIGKLIFGEAAYSQIQKFVRTDDNKDKLLTEFGYNPLAKIGKLMNYELHLVYIKTNDNDFSEIIKNKNDEFIDEMEKDILNYLLENTEKKALLTEKEKLNRAVDELLEYL
jgi:uncharacterized protein (UPF0297 family)